MGIYLYIANVGFLTHGVFCWGVRENKITNAYAKFRPTYTGWEGRFGNAHLSLDNAILPVANGVFTAQKYRLLLFSFCFGE